MECTRISDGQYTTWLYSTFQSELQEIKACLGRPVARRSLSWFFLICKPSHNFVFCYELVYVCYVLWIIEMYKIPYLMIFKLFMKPSLMWVFHMNAGLACERLEFTLWPQLPAWTTITRYIVAYMSYSRLLIVSWSIPDFSSIEASWANVPCFAQLLTSGVAPTVFPCS